MICVSLAGPKLEDVRAAMARLDFVELRLDLIQASEVQVEALVAGHSNCLITCRPGRNLDDEGRQGLLCAGLRAGARWLDLELESDLVWRDALLAQARKTSCRVIISHHDHEGTPSRDALLALRQACFAAGAEVAKIACMVRRPKDSARLLGLLDEPEPTLVIGMGPQGRLCRVLAPLLGSPFTYASQAEGQETAPGQLDLRTLQSWLSRLRDLTGEDSA